MLRREVFQRSAKTRGIRGIFPLHFQRMRTRTNSAEASPSQRQPHSPVFNGRSSRDKTGRIPRTSRGTPGKGETAGEAGRIQTHDEKRKENGLRTKRRGPTQNSRQRRQGRDEEGREN